MNCPKIPLISYRKFGTRFRKMLVAKKIPSAGSIELTLRCNLRCVQCYGRDCKLSQEEMSTKEVFYILDEIADAGCFWLLLTGGEPLLRDDFIDIYTHAKKKGFIITIFTNGTLIDQRIADCLKNILPYTIEITLYGMSDETYERVTGVAGAYKRCMNGIEMLLKRKIPFSLKATLTTLNKDDVPLMRRFAKEHSLGFKFDTLVHAALDGSLEPCQFRVPPGEAVELDLADKEKYREWKKRLKDFKGLPPQSDYLYPCAVDLIYFQVTPDAKLCACVLAREPSFDLRQNSFEKCWKDLTEHIQTLRPSENTKCRKCILFGICDYCPPWGELEKGDPYAHVEYLCEIARKRAEAFVKEGFIKMEGGEYRNGYKDRKEDLQKTLNTSS